jgi:hypothetical protein
MKKLIFAALITLFFAFTPSFALAASPKLFFNSPEIGVKQGDEFDVVVKIDTFGQKVTGGDAVIEYNPEMIEVSLIENGGFFPLFGKHYELSSQKIYITGFFTEKNQSKDGTGVFAKISLRALKNGISNLQFSCVNKSLSDTNIINIKGDDVIICGELSPLKITISGNNFIVGSSSSFGKILGTDSGSLVATSTPTRFPSPTTPVSTTSALMETGVFDNAALMIMFGSVFIVLGGFLLIYSRHESYI